VHARLSESGLEQNLKVYIDEDEREINDTAYEFNCGYALARRMLAENTSVTAIIAVNDMTAAGCMALLNERGIAIPDQMAIGGFDNLMTSRMLHPPLTTIDQMASHGCKVGLNILLDKIRNVNREAYPIKMEYQPHLIVRGSTQPASK
jgi:DNA-binding LacI/PurR family transcriptional regulator